MIYFNNRVSFLYNKDLVYHHRWNKRILHSPQIFSHQLNSMICNYISKNKSVSWLFGMVIWNGRYVLASNIIIQRIKFYDFKNQLMIVVIDSYYIFFLFSAIYIHKISNHSFCYNFTYSQRPRYQMFLWIYHDHTNNPLLKILFPVHISHLDFFIWQVI